MFSFKRLAELVGAAQRGGQTLVDTLLAELAAFTGPGWAQEHDITLVTLECHALPRAGRGAGKETAIAVTTDHPDSWQTLAELEIASAPDNERLAMEQVAAAVAGVGLPALRLERLKTAVAEATMNALEHGNGYRAELPVRISVRRSAHRLSVRIVDHGQGPADEAAAPDLLAKLEGQQTARGWGLHLIRHMVDEMRVEREDGKHVVELLVKL
jgi:anti-sigma regulatory factor (Ser/Thr protein kinase)